MKRVDYRRIRTHRIYTVVEAAERLGVHEHTMRAWIKAGLAVIDDKRPLLIRGGDLKIFAKTARQKSRRPCEPGEMYCLRCRVPRRPALGMVEFEVSHQDAAGNLRALCSSCEAVMRQRASDRTRAVFERLYTVEFRQPQDTL